MTGFIKDHRKELDSDIWLMPPLYHRTWQWLKYNVNHADNEIPMRDGTKMLIKRGQRLTSVRDVAKGVSWYEGKKYKEPNPKTISAILDWMVKTDMILITRGQSNREYTLITLIKYEEYQQLESQGNSKVTVEKQLVDINKNDKELLKNDYKDISTTTADAYESVGDIHLKVFKTFSMSGLMSDFIKKIKDKGHSDNFVKELMLEAGESSNGVPNIRFIETIYQRWDSENINSRVESSESKKRKTSNVHHINRSGTSRKQPIPIIADSPKGMPMSPELKLIAMLDAKLLDGDITEKEYEEQIAQYKPRASPDEAS